MSFTRLFRRSLRPGPTVEFVERLRDEQRFDGLEALTTQLRADVDRTRERVRL